MGVVTQTSEASGDDAIHPFAAAFMTTGMPMLITDARQSDNPIAYANEAFTELTGYRREELLGRNCRMLQGPATDPDLIEAMRRAVSAGEAIELEILNYRKDGRPFWNALHISPVRNAAGTISHFFSSQHDVTAKKDLELKLQQANSTLEAQVERRTRALQEALEAKELLLHEIDHRVKNNLQLVGSLLAIQARRIPDPAVRDSINQALERVSALSLVHQGLYASGEAAVLDVGGFIRQLALDLVAASGREDIRVELDLEPASIDAGKAAPMALILNELLTNALRHAFPDGRSGTIRVHLRDGSGMVRLDVRDDGVGEAAAPSRTGIGTMLVRQLARQLGAEVAWSPGPGGMTVTLELPPAAGVSHGG